MGEKDFWRVCELDLELACWDLQNDEPMFVNLAHMPRKQSVFISALSVYVQGEKNSSDLRFQRNKTTFYFCWHSVEAENNTSFQNPAHIQTFWG